MVDKAGKVWYNVQREIEFRERNFDYEALTAPEGVWLPVDEESILATADSGVNLKVGEDKATGWGKLIQIGRL